MPTITANNNANAANTRAILRHQRRRQRRIEAMRDRAHRPLRERLEDNIGYGLSLFALAYVGGHSLVALLA